MKKSWRTTLSGVLAGVMLLIAQGQTLLDDDPKTNPEYTVIMSAFALISLGWTARDEKVTSEEAGAK